MTTLSDSGTAVDDRNPSGNPINDLNQIKGRTVGGATWTYSYDLNGNLTGKTDGTNTFTYTWSDENRLTRVQGPGGLDVTYSYDSIGRMMSRTSGGVTTTFVWDGWDCVREVSPGADCIYHIPDGVLHSFSLNGVVYQVHMDALGSVRLVTDSSGAVVARFEYGAWGEEIFSSVDSALTGFAYRFVGALGVRTDLETGLVWMRNRWYDPSSMRFVSRDPIGLRGGANLYAYAHGNPTLLVDPMGLDTATAGAMVGAGIRLGLGASEIAAGIAGAVIAVPIGVLGAGIADNMRPVSGTGGGPYFGDTMGEDRWGGRVYSQSDFPDEAANPGAGDGYQQRPQTPEQRGRPAGRLPGGSDSKLPKPFRKKKRDCTLASTWMTHNQECGGDGGEKRACFYICGLKGFVLTYTLKPTCPKTYYFLALGREGIFTDGSWKYYLSDGLGSTVALVDEDGNSIAEWDYGDYGETEQIAGDPGLYNPYLFTGQEWDSELGMYNLRARHYSPSLGRFLARDSIGYSGGSNLYAYCNGDPVNFIDPSGTLVKFSSGGQNLESFSPGFTTKWNEAVSLAQEKFALYGYSVFKGYQVIYKGDIPGQFTGLRDSQYQSDIKYEDYLTGGWDVTFTFKCGEGFASDMSGQAEAIDSHNVYIFDLALSTSAKGLANLILHELTHVGLMRKHQRSDYWNLPEFGGIGHPAKYFGQGIDAIPDGAW